MTAETVEIEAFSINGIGEEEDVVTPWNVTSKNDTGIDYDKLISKL